MVGAFVAAGDRGVPAVVDGFVSGAAALLALRTAAPSDPGQAPRLRRCLFWAHRSGERGAGALLAAAGATAALDLGLRLGEGTGALLALPLLRASAAVMAEMAALKDLPPPPPAAGAAAGAGTEANGRPA